MIIMPMPDRLLLKLLVKKPKTSSNGLPSVALPKIGVPVSALAINMITIPEVKKTKIALYFFSISFATITEKITVNDISKTEFIASPPYNENLLTYYSILKSKEKEKLEYICKNGIP